MILVGVIQAQSDQTGDKGALDVLKALGEKSQSQKMLDLIIGQSQSRFLDDYVDAAEYIVGPGDEFVIYFLATGILNISCRINSDGRMFIKSAGAIEIGHSTLARAIELIRKKVSENYNRAEFTVQLTNFRFAKVVVLGEVHTPDIYYVPATWRVSEVIALAGGLTSKASLRNIKLGGFGKEVEVDLVRYSKLAETGANPMICRGNLLMIPMMDKSMAKISVSGEVIDASIYEYKAEDKIDDYIRFAGGLKGRIEDVEISIYSNQQSEETVLDGATGDLSGYLLNAGDNINIRLKADRDKQTEVMIFGAVNRPGRYALEISEKTLDHLLRRSGGIKASASPEMIQIFRMSPLIAFDKTANRSPNGRSLTIEADQSAVHRLLSHNPRQPIDFSRFDLADGDSIFIPDRTGMVMVAGAVAFPGLVTFQEGKKVDYYIRAAGGYTSEADKSKAVVINNYSGGRVDANAAGKMFDGETVMVPRKESKR